MSTVLLTAEGDHPCDPLLEISFNVALKCIAFTIHSVRGYITFKVFCFKFWCEPLV